LKTPKEIFDSPVFTIIKEFYCIIRKHPKKSAIVIIFHIWVYGLAFHHIKEIKDFMDLFTKVF